MNKSHHKSSPKQIQKLVINELLLHVVASYFCCIESNYNIHLFTFKNHLTHMKKHHMYIYIYKKEKKKDHTLSNTHTLNVKNPTKKQTLICLPLQISSPNITFSLLQWGQQRVGAEWGAAGAVWCWYKWRGRCGGRTAASHLPYLSQLSHSCYCAGCGEIRLGVVALILILILLLCIFLHLPVFSQGNLPIQISSLLLLLLLLFLLLWQFLLFPSCLSISQFLFNISTSLLLPD